MSNKNKFLGMLVFATLLMASCGSKPNFNAKLKTELDSVSYFFGYYLGVQLAHSGVDNTKEINFNTLARGIDEAMQNGKDVDDEKWWELQSFLSEYIAKVQSRANEALLKEGWDFLAANQSKPGVVTLPSGLQYRIIRDGSGARPTINDMVEVVYHGSLIDGTIFDSSKERGDTVAFPVGNLVIGFSDALTLMNEGSIWEIFIPSELGYGEEGRQGIPPHSVMIFEIDLVKILKFDIDEE